MIYRHTDEQIQYYFLAPALNQSSIKVIIKDGIQKYREQEDELISKEDLYYEEKEHFVIGSAVDCIISQGVDIFEKKYAYSTLVNKPSDTVMSIVKLVFDKEVNTNNLSSRPISNNILDYSRELYDSCNEHSYYMSRKIPSDKLVKYEEVNTLTGQKTGKKLNGPDARSWEEDKRVENFLVDGTVVQYWKELIDSQGKQLLSEYEKNKVLATSNSLLTHNHTKRMFEDGEDVDIIYQMPLFFEINEVMCKALPDQIRINHSVKRVFITDIKTMGGYVLTFNRDLRVRRYDIQGSFYLRAVKENLGKIGNLIGKDITNYEIANPAFIVESTNRPGTPMIYPMTDGLIDVGTNGDARGYLGGYVQGVELFKQWKLLDYSLDKRFKPTNGVVWIDGEFNYSEIF